MDQIIKEARSLSDQGKSTEEIIAFLKERGLSKVWSTKVLSEACGLDLRSAKEAVHFSSAWAEVRKAHEAFQDQLIENVSKVSERKTDE
jgi:ribosomal protein L7/L12